VSILETTEIDIVATRPDSSVVRLVIADHLDWGDFQGHAELLQAKVNTYLAFVESGQMRRMQNPPIPADARVEIVLAAQHAPTAQARELLEQVRAFLQEEGFTFLLDVKDA
jgi:hypothetical protein